MQVQVQHQRDLHRFIITLPDGVARLEYSLQEKWVNIFHTWVPDSLRGKGVADALMRACADWCGQQHLQMVATCSYALRWLDRHKSSR